VSKELSYFNKPLSGSIILFDVFGSFTYSKPWEFVEKIQDRV
jgi:hypothetical protein